MRHALVVLAFAAAIPGCGTGDDASAEGGAGMDASAADGTQRTGTNDATLGGGDGMAPHVGDATVEASADSGAPATYQGVLQFHNDINRDGLYADAIITNGAATLHRDTTFDGTISGNVYGQPLYVVNGPGGAAAVYVATESDNIYALSAATGLPIWQKNMGTPATQSGAGCGNISPIGITGTPAIDIASRTIVFVAVTADDAGDVATHTMYGLSIDNGDERWHVDISTLTDQMGRPFAPQPSNARSAILLLNGMAYASWGGYTGDCGNYHGWITGVSVADGLTVTTYATPALAAGMWAPGGPASDGTSVFAITGNREPPSSTAAWNGGQGVLRLGATLTFTEQPQDYWVPDNWMTTLDPEDLDLGGSGPLVVDAPSMTPSALIVAQGKDGKVYLLDRNNLGGLATPPLGSHQVMNGGIIAANAFATIGGTTYLAIRGYPGTTVADCPDGGTGDDLVVYKLDPTATDKMSLVWCNYSVGHGSPIITMDPATGTALVWTAGAENSNRIYSWNLVTGAQVYFGGLNGDTVLNLREFTTILDAAGRLFVGADNQVFAFKPQDSSDASADQ